MPRLRFLLPALMLTASLSACAAGAWPIARASGPTSALARAGLSYRLYVPELSGNSVTIYNARGKRVLTISNAVYGPAGVAVDANGKIYVANAFGGGHGHHRGLHGTVTTYTPDGRQTTPTITAGLDFPTDVAVDANGKIYVVNDENNTVTTYLPDGTQTTPTITGLHLPTGVAVDAAGKIYVANRSGGHQKIGSITTYDVDGQQTTPTITTAIEKPAGVAVDANDKIYVANYGWFDTGSVTTYNVDGMQTTPTITKGIDNASGVAVDALGDIHVANFQGPGKKGGFGYVTTYTGSGARTKPTITKGILAPGLLTVH